MTLCIVGAGAFGSALASNFARNAKRIILWSRSQERLENLQKNINSFIKEKHQKNIALTNDLEFAIKEASTILICIPAQTVFKFFLDYHSKIPNIPIVLCSKGIDEQTLFLQSQIIKKFLSRNEIAVLSGPSFAEELAEGLPTALTLACKNKKIRNSLQNSLSNSTLRLYSSEDIIGTQLGGALKNVIAIGCGMIKSINLGESARTAFMTRGLSEMIDLGVTMGAKINTFYGLSGLGDLSLTCSSIQSRNYCFGLNYFKNLDPNPKSTVEGVKTSSAARQLSKNQNVDTPIIDMVDLILKDKISVEDSIHDLLSRPLKKEFI